MDKEQIRQRWSKATKGPWWFDEDELVWRLHGGGNPVEVEINGAKYPMPTPSLQILKAPKKGTPYAEYWPEEADAEALAHSWQDVHDLLAALDNANALSEECEVHCDTVHDLVAALDAAEAKVRELSGLCIGALSCLPDPDRPPDVFGMANPAAVVQGIKVALKEGK